MSAKPKRVTIERRKGWTMPPGAVNCSRPGIWGNPFKVVPCEGGYTLELAPPRKGQGIDAADSDILRNAQCYAPFKKRPDAQAMAVDCYRLRLDSTRRSGVRHWLRGKDLACHCKEKEPCHCDVLLEVANSDKP